MCNCRCVVTCIAINSLKRTEYGEKKINFVIALRAAPKLRKFYHSLLHFFPFLAHLSVLYNVNDRWNVRISKIVQTS